MSLRVRLLSAHLSHDTELFSNMDPYCYLQLGSQRYRSKTKNQAGKKPVWNENFSFTSSDNTLKITVMDEDTITDDLVGDGTINVAQFRNNPTEQQQTVQLYYKGRTAGKVIITIAGGQGSQNAWGNNATNNTWGQNNMNPYGQSYNQPNYNQQYGQPNQWQASNQYQGGNQWGNNPYGNNANWGSQGNMAPTNSPWGDLSQNNGWGNFSPNVANEPYSNPNIASNPQNINPLQVIGGIFGNSNNQPPPPPQNGYGNNPYSGNPYR